MGEAETKKSRGVSLTIHSWMGEPCDQGEDEKTLELSLGLPGGGGGGGQAGWRTASKHKGRRSTDADTSMLSLGYSAAPLSPRSQGKAKGSPAATGSALASTNNGSQTRPTTAPVIGWPPVGTFRRNLATSSKAPLDQQNGKNPAKAEETKRAPFVKINMDGIPIGRKIDLNALDSYDMLSLAVDKLFRGLLAAQQDPLDALRTKECPREEVAISGLLDGTGEYTLVYEDYEGDRVLVGDVPWGMFVSSVKRLRVLKTSDLSSSLTASGRKRAAAEC